MKLDRNINNDRRGKYALLLLRKLALCEGGTFSNEIEQAVATLDKAGLIDWGIVGTESEFFVIRLKDRHAATALGAYGDSAMKSDPEWGREIHDMAMRAEISQWQKEPD